MNKDNEILEHYVKKITIMPILVTIAQHSNRMKQLFV